MKDYVNSCYNKEAHILAYIGQVFPILDSRFWLPIGLGKVTHPPYKKRLGRPLKKRREAIRELENQNAMRRSG